MLARRMAERPSRPAVAGMEAEAGRLSRRELLRAGVLAGVGWRLGAAPVDAWGASEPPRIRRRVTLGRTGLEVPDISFGTFALRGDERLVHHALERGITHFDTAEGYTRGDAERTLGQGLAHRSGGRCAAGAIA